MIKWIKSKWSRFTLLFSMPSFERHLTILFYGPRSAGKSLHMAKTGRAILFYLDDLYRAYPGLNQAIVLTNNAYNKKIEKRWMDIPNPRLFYWESIHQLRYCPRKDCWKARGEAGVPLARHRLHDCYILFDDIATIIPADGWSDLPKWFRKTFAQAGHNGIHCIANIQDPVSCDINFRRYVDVAVKFEKIFGSRRPEEAKPPVKYIYGIYTTRSVGADHLFKKGDMTEQEIQAYLEEHPEMTKIQWKWSWHWIKRFDTEIYDTLQNVPEYMPNALEHIETKCMNPDCDYVHVKHRAV